MGKKIFLIVMGGLAVCGLALGIVGFALGGHTGNMMVSDGKVVYNAGGQTKELGSAPSWWRMPSNWKLFSFNRYDYDYEDSVNYTHGNYNEESHGEGDWDDHSGNPAAATVPAVPTVPDAPTVPTVPAANPANIAKEYRDIDIDISAGYITLRTGNTPGLTVNGPLSYTSEQKNGQWVIRSQHNLDSIRSSSEIWGDRPRFYQNGKDVTTEYILELPATAGKVEIDLGMGVMEVDGLNLTEGDFTIEIGEMKVYNSTIQDSSFTASLGSVKVTDFMGKKTDLETELGTIEFSGNLTGNLDASSNLGSIKATLNRPANYGWSTETSMGSIKIDGKTYGGFESNATGGTKSQGTPFYELSCELGSIELNFK